MRYLTEEWSPGLSDLIDKEKITRLATYIGNTIISPTLKVKDPTKMQLHNHVLKLAVSLVLLSSTANAWKKDLWLVFMESKFFNLNLSSLNSWKILIHGIIANESDILMSEILSKISITSGPAIFSSKDQGILDCSLMIRRLSFVVFASPFDFYLAKLPAIQEKIAESLKLGSPILQVEILFFIQILLLRISSKNLSNLWLVINYELVKVFSFHIKNSSVDKWELKSLLEATKVLYIACLLKVDEFQSYQWIFLEDYSHLIVDAKRPPLIVALKQSIQDSLMGPLALDVNLKTLLTLRNIGSKNALLSFLKTSFSEILEIAGHTMDEDLILENFHQSD